MASSNSSIEQGSLVRQWSWPLRMVFWWFVIGVCAWAFSVGAQWLWALKHSPDDPLAYEQLVLEREVQALSELAPGFFEPRELAAWIGNGIRDTALLSAMGFARTLMNWPVAYRKMAEARASQRAGTPDAVPANGADAGGDFVAAQVATAGGTWAMLVTGTYIFAVRTAMYLAALSLLGALIALAAVEGLVVRAQRKATAGRESASLYHRAKLGFSFVGILGYIACVLVPSMADPVVVLVPVAMVMALLLRLQAAYYKKYL